MIQNVNIGDSTLTVSIKGNGKPFLFVHGAAGSFEHSHFLEKYLLHDFEFISYSQRFHLPNDPCAPGTYGPVLHASDLIALLNVLNLEDVTALGHSYGGNVLLTAAIHAPQRFKRIYLAEPSIPNLVCNKLEYAGLLEQRTQAMMKIRAAFETGYAAKAVKALMDYAIGESGFEILPGEIRMDMIANATSLYHLVYKQATITLAEEELRNMNVPVCILNGEDCTPIYKAIADILLQFLPNVEMQNIPEAAHDLIYNAAKECSLIIRSHLE
ncbi:hypothetical protein BH11BAC2_BH11BAC2_05780 [soil metagenome]